MPHDENSLKEQNGPFSGRLSRKEFAVSVEVVPPRGADLASLQRKVAGLARLAASGRVDGINVVDGSLSQPLLFPGDFITAARRSLGWEPGREPLEWITHVAARQQNLMALERRLYGLHLLGLHNLFLTTGDPPAPPPGYPPLTPLIDADSTALIGYVHRLMNSGLDLAGRPLACPPGQSPHFTLGSGLEPSPQPARQLENLKRKMEAGLDYAITQITFDLDRLESFRGVALELPVLIGVLVLTSPAQAGRAQRIPGVEVPSSLLERLAHYAQPADQEKAGIEAAVQTAARVRREGWAGICLTAASPRVALEVLNALT